MYQEQTRFGVELYARMQSIFLPASSPKHKSLARQLSPLLHMSSSKRRAVVPAASSSPSPCCAREHELTDSIARAVKSVNVTSVVSTRLSPPSSPRLYMSFIVPQFINTNLPRGRRLVLTLLAAAVCAFKNHLVFLGFCVAVKVDHKRVAATLTITCDKCHVLERVITIVAFDDEQEAVFGSDVFGKSMFMDKRTFVTPFLYAPVVGADDLLGGDDVKIVVREDAVAGMNVDTYEGLSRTATVHQQARLDAIKSRCVHGGEGGCECFAPIAWEEAARRGARFRELRCFLLVGLAAGDVARCAAVKEGTWVQ